MNKNYFLSILASLAISIGFAASPEKPKTILAVDFTVSDTLTCSGNVKFTDNSNNGASAWLWNFGDGGASTAQNPTHSYTTSGYFTVHLTTLGIAGIDSIVKTDYVHVDFLTAPVVSADTTICQYNPAVLTALGSVGTIAWFDSIVGGNMVYVGDTFTTGSITATTTFYASSLVSSGSAFGGPPDSALGGGSMYTTPQNRYMIFDCNVACRLVSFLVYAQGAGNRTVYLADNNGVNLQTAVVNVPDGASRIYVNFDIQPGTGYRVGIVTQGGGGGGGGTAANLYRNNTGAVYPYDINGQVSITGNNGAQGYYYFFYDWEISNPPCVSPRMPVTVTVTPGPQASFITGQNLNIISVLDLSLGSLSWSWDYGDGSALDTLQNPAPHVYAAAGTYNITLTVSNGTCSSSLVVPVVISTAAGINQLNAANVAVMPNPVKDMMTVSFPGITSNVTFTLTSSLGQVVYTSNGVEIKNNTAQLNLASLKAGIYILKMETKEGIILKKIIKE